MDAKLRQKLQEWLGDRVRFDEPMNRHTYFRIGGPADAWVEPESTEELVALVAWARAEAVPFRMVGGGTNLLVRDGGIRELVISPKRCLTAIAVTGSVGDAVRITAMAGARLQSLCRFAVERGLDGMGFAVGIPGTVGGAVVMNAGTHTGCMADIVCAVTVLPADGRVRVLEGDRLGFVYRGFRPVVEDGAGDASEPPLVLGADVVLASGDSDRIAAETTRLLEQRRMRQPVEAASAGCFFKNPPEGPSAGELIDRAGLKGLRIGGAEVSPRHANYLINTGAATAADVLELADRVRRTVQRRFGVTLEEEVRIIGDA